MVIIMDSSATQEQTEKVIARVVQLGFDVYRITGMVHTLLGAVGDRVIDTGDIEALDGVRQVLRISTPYKLSNRSVKPAGTQIAIRGVTVGGPEIAIMARLPWEAEPDQAEGAIEFAHSAGFHGIWIGQSRIEASFAPDVEARRHRFMLCRSAADRLGLALIIEAAEIAYLASAAEFADAVHISGTGMYSQALLHAAGATGRCVLVERGPSATIEETLVAADRVLRAGNENVVLLEAGMRSFDSLVKQGLDISIVPRLKRFSHLPVAVDLSRVATNREQLIWLAQAAVAAGSDCVVIPVAGGMGEGLAGPALPRADCLSLVARLRGIAESVGRKLSPPAVNNS